MYSISNIALDRRRANPGYLSVYAQCFEHYNALMPSIEVDFDVFKAITARRAREEITDNDVLREVLGLPHTKANRAMSPSPGDWIIKGIRLSAGTELRASYKGLTYLARVENGALMLEGTAFSSPSAAAVSITGRPTNGWRFWHSRVPGQSRWTLLETLRSDRNQG